MSLTTFLYKLYCIYLYRSPAFKWSGVYLNAGVYFLVFTWIIEHRVECQMPINTGDSMWSEAIKFIKLHILQLFTKLQVVQKDINRCDENTVTITKQDALLSSFILRYGTIDHLSNLTMLVSSIQIGSGIHFICSVVLPGIYLSPCMYMISALIRINTVCM